MPDEGRDKVSKDKQLEMPGTAARVWKDRRRRCAAWYRFEQSVLANPVAREAHDAAQRQLDGPVWDYDTAFSALFTMGFVAGWLAQHELLSQGSFSTPRELLEEWVAANETDENH